MRRTNEGRICFWSPEGRMFSTRLSVPGAGPALTIAAASPTQGSVLFWVWHQYGTN